MTRDLTVLLDDTFTVTAIVTDPSGVGSVSFSFKRDGVQTNFCGQGPLLLLLEMCSTGPGPLAVLCLPMSLAGIASSPRMRETSRVIGPTPTAAGQIRFVPSSPSNRDLVEAVFATGEALNAECQAGLGEVAGVVEVQVATMCCYAVTTHGGFYASPNVQGTRSGLPMAAA